MSLAPEAAEKLERARAWVSSHLLLVAAVLLALGAAVGRWSAPMKVRTEVKTEVKEVEKVVTKEVAAKTEAKAEVKASSGGVRIHRVVVREACPGGQGVVTRTTEDISSGHQETERKGEVSAQAESREATADRRVEAVTQRKEERGSGGPTWRATARVGVEAAPLLNGGLSGPLGGFPWLFAGEMDRRVLGPFSIGLWGQWGRASGVSAGVAAGVDW